MIAQALKIFAKRKTLLTNFVRESIFKKGLCNYDQNVLPRCLGRGLAEEHEFAQFGFGVKI